MPEAPAADEAVRDGAAAAVEVLAREGLAGGELRVGRGRAVGAAGGQVDVQAGTSLEQFRTGLSYSKLHGTALNSPVGLRDHLAMGRRVIYTRLIIFCMDKQ